MDIMWITTLFELVTLILILIEAMNHLSNLWDPIVSKNPLKKNNELVNGLLNECFPIQKQMTVISQE